MNPSLLAAVAQLAPTVDGARNREQIAALTADAARSGARLVVFPEESMLLAGDVEGRLGEVVDAEWPLFLAQLSLLAVEHELWIIAGGYEPTGSDRPYNTLVVVNPRGEVVESYRKLHLYDAFGQRESDWVEPGDLTAPETFEIDGLRFGLMTCYDLRFPEMGRTLADAGADVFLVPAEWVRGPLKEHHWRTLIHARAIENTVFVAAADHPPPLGVGNSMIVDPQGVEIAAIGTGTDVVVAHLDPATVERVRRVNPALQLRRMRVVPRD